MLDEHVLIAHRPALLRHCYRMVGSFAEAEDLVQDVLVRAWSARGSYAGTAPVNRWLFSIATHACLNALAQRRRRALPQLEAPPATDAFVLKEEEPSRWVTPAPDGQLFPSPADDAESKETIALAFIALAQTVPPRQRAALLLKDVLGFAAEEIAQELELSVPAVNSALHRARETLARARAPADEPAPATLAALLRAWQTRDLERLISLLREDIEMAMPPHPVWLRGTRAVAAFLVTPRFAAYWASVTRLTPTRANGLPALIFHRPTDGGPAQPHSVMVARFVEGLVAELTVFVGPPLCAASTRRPNTRPRVGEPGSGTTSRSTHRGAMAGGLLIPRAMESNQKTQWWDRLLRLPAEDQPKVRLFAITAWVGAGILGCTSLLSVTSGLTTLGLIDFVGLLVCLNSLRQLHATPRAVGVFLWTFAITLPLAALATDPMDPTVLGFLFVLPLLSANMLGVTKTRQWFVRIMILGALALTAGHHGYVVHDHEAAPAAKQVVNFVGALAATMAQLFALARESDRSVQRLREAERAKDAFFANLGHEIRTPMNGVIGMTDALLMRPLAAPEKEMIETIRSSGAVMLSLVDDLLDYSKLEAGRLVLRETDVDLSALKNELQQLWHPLAARKQLTLSLSLDPALPGTICLDGLRLRQILGNLISNAIKFTEAGGVAVRLEGVGAQLRCEVADTGIGISVGQQARLFARFVQADDARARRYQGAGLGLVLSRELACLMGGSLEVRSTAGAGSAFTCSVPLVSAAAPRPGPAVVQHEVPPGLRVLVVDDNAVNRLVAQRLLERCGCEVAVSVDGLSALTALEQPGNFDLVLMDIHMPLLDGLETTRLIRARHGEALRIIGVSASAESADTENCRQAGMNDFLAKPITRERLVRTLLRNGDEVVTLVAGASLPRSGVASTASTEQFSSPPLS